MSSQAPSQVTPQHLMQTVWSFMQPLALDAAIQNHVFDVLDAGPKTLEEVSHATGASVRGLAAVMNLLVGVQFLAKTTDGRYSLTPESSAFLVSTKPGYHGGFVHHIVSGLITDFLPLAEVVRTGKPVESNVDSPNAAGFFEELVANILPIAYPGARVVAEALGVSRAVQQVSVLDIGAGSGVWGIALAQASPQVRVTAVDLPGVLPVTRKIAQQFGVAGQFTCAGKDIFQDDLGSGYSVATLGHILHMASPDRNRFLLKNIFRALAPGGTLVIGEFIVNEDRTGPVEPLAFAVNMLVHTEQGNAYTLGEIRSWLQEVGFVNVRTLAAPAPSPLILADKPAL
ncbi:MAG: methyltransferase domain-containing protein [Acidobacteriia bacterium]|nr:methyltransferase domain-containing protein [Terriglobia bacterium]